MESDIIKNLISRVNSTLGYYEKDYISAKRTPYSEEGERCSTFEQYVEIRFNYECFQVPEFRDLIIATDGHLFSCVSLEDQDIAKRRFSTACLMLINPDNVTDLDNDTKEEIKNLYSLIGGSCIKFNNVRKKIKFTIE